MNSAKKSAYLVTFRNTVEKLKLTGRWMLRYGPTVREEGCMYLEAYRPREEPWASAPASDLNKDAVWIGEGYIHVRCDEQEFVFDPAA